MSDLKREGDKQGLNVGTGGCTDSKIASELYDDRFWWRG